MKHLVLAVSPDSSLELLGKYADIVVLDKNPTLENMKHYESMYIRSHFGQQSTLPQNFRNEIEQLIERARRENPTIRFIDTADTVDKIVSFEDKWFQYETFSDFMPNTRILTDIAGNDDFNHPIYKQRLSSRGNGVTWDVRDITDLADNWIIQESLDIKEELRIYLINGDVYPVGAVRQSKNTEQSTQAVDSRELTEDEIRFASEVGKKRTNMDIVGLDVVRTIEGILYLLEVNRSPGFGAFEKLTGVNLADILYS